MDLNKIKALTEEIKKLEEELKIEKELVLESFRNMSEEDSALCENRMSGNGIIIQYFPKSTTKVVDTAKLKEDGLFEKYSKESNKSDYIKVNIAKE